jgi:hypothetical protein
MTPRETQLFVDEVDGEVARMVLGEEVFTMPRALLPRDAVEGSWVRMSIGVVPAPPDDTERKRKELARDDPGGDIEL